ncbi:MAG: VWA domain-containing protein [Nostocoides sp.]
MPVQYPFSAVLGCGADQVDDMGLALVLTTISPEIGGVLIRGEKGTAKSTAVRALASVLPPVTVYADDRFSIDPDDSSTTSPDGPFDADTEQITRPVRLVELPVGATEDRVLGSLHLERALTRGRVEYEPGLLAKAHRGILYVDEVNLLHDHLVDLLLDAAAMGQATVERDGVSLEHAARFVLIGTMNPEEGELRPQLLDRFGLTVQVAAPRDPALRVEVVRRRMTYDADPAGFAATYAAADAAVTARIASARDRMPHVAMSESALLKVAEVCAAFEVDGMRADIVTTRTAIAYAAWSGREEVTTADIRQAALLALPHRRRRNPFDAPGLDEDLLDEILGTDDPPPQPPQPPQPPSDPGDCSDPEEGAGPSDNAGAGHPTPQDAATADPTGQDLGDAGSQNGQPRNDEPRDVTVPPSPHGPENIPGADAVTVVSAATPFRPKLLTVRGVGAGTAGRRSRALADNGRRIGAIPGNSGSLHLVETLMAAAGQQPGRTLERDHHRRGGGRVVVRTEDLRVAVREGREANLVLFCVDASGSMAARKRMTQVKTAILSLLLDAYRRRDKVGLITFRGLGADLVLPPTHSVEIAAVRLDELPAGGRTPLAEGLLEAASVLTRERLRDPRLRPLLVLVTDGRATGGEDAVSRSLRAADHLARLGVTTVVLDGEFGPLRLGLARKLAARLNAEHLPVTEVSAATLMSAVTRHTRPDHSPETGSTPANGAA